MQKTDQNTKQALQGVTKRIASASNIEPRLQQQKALTQILRTLHHIQQSYSNKLSLDELAELANMSRYHYSRSFKKITGLSPVHYLNVYRLNKAGQLLIMTNWPVTRIAQEVGFNHSSNFVVHFKKVFTLTPSRYRQTMRESLTD